ncbi:MAG: hypothetical protein ABI206_15290 [Antricoccus sp.]
MTQPPRGQPYVRHHRAGRAPQTAAGQLPQRGKPYSAAAPTFIDHAGGHRYGQRQILTKRPKSGPWVIAARVEVAPGIALTPDLVLNRGASLAAAPAFPEEVTASFGNAVNDGHKMGNLRLLVRIVDVLRGRSDGTKND